MSTCNAPPQAPYQPSWPARTPAQKTAREECILGRPCRATECNESEAPSSPDCGPSVSPSGGKRQNKFEDGQYPQGFLVTVTDGVVTDLLDVDVPQSECPLRVVGESFGALQRD